MKVKILKEYTDLALKRTVNSGEEIEVTDERAAKLSSLGIIEPVNVVPASDVVKTECAVDEGLKSVWDALNRLAERVSVLEKMNEPPCAGSEFEPEADAAGEPEVNPGTKTAKTKAKNA